MNTVFTRLRWPASPLEAAPNRLGIVALGCLALVGACREFPSAPTLATPVINITLIAGDSEQVAVITEAARADSAIPRSPIGIGAERVRLSVQDRDGVNYPVASTQVAGRFTISVVVRPAERYRLVGSIDGLPISAETAVPASFLVRLPAGDTITATEGTGTGIFLELPYSFESAGASAYGYFTLTAGGSVPIGGLLDRAEGVLLLVRGADLNELVLMAFNSDAADWLARSTPRGNVAGAFGAFGAALVVRRPLRLQ